MDERNETRPETTADRGEQPEEPKVPATTTRRTFLSSVGKKTAYITPVLLTLTASPAMASNPHHSCARTGSPCGVDDDCCGSLTCTGGICDPP
ncbi:MAG: hypothetical protein KAV82_09540 [Phycisphaerae bacterium]|nr:hypothetical protein [Phycisphaerae bacterium]